MLLLAWGAEESSRICLLWGAPWALHRAPASCFPVEPGTPRSAAGVHGVPEGVGGLSVPPSLSAAGTVPGGGRLGLSNPPPLLPKRGDPPDPVPGTWQVPWELGTGSHSNCTGAGCSQRTSALPGFPRPVASPHVGPQDVQHLGEGTGQVRGLTPFLASEPQSVWEALGVGADKVPKGRGPPCRGVQPGPSGQVLATSGPAPRVRILGPGRSSLAFP